MHGFQLWAYPPSSLEKTPPHHQYVSSAESPEVPDDDESSLKHG
jgi:redox-sensitive bicupin YhaK (pirin superfamily)